MKLENTTENTARAWSKLGQHYAKSSVHKFGPSLPKLLALARPTNQDICLDIGTGTGHTAAALAPYANKVYGLDPAEGMLEAAKKLYGHLENLEFVLASGDKTGFEDDRFDIVTARHTLHHHSDIPRTLAEIKRILKPGGRLVIVDEVTPNAEIDSWYHLLEQTRDPTHQRAYLLSEWQSFISEAGLCWVVGDAETWYRLEVKSWLARMAPSPEQAAAVKKLLKEADPMARACLNITFDQGEALSFDMPMGIILALRPDRHQD